MSVGRMAFRRIAARRMSFRRKSLRRNWQTTTRLLLQSTVIVLMAFCCVMIFVVPRVNLNTTRPVVRPQPLNSTIQLVDDVTVVTAYFNIGNFGKGSATNMFTPDMYSRWMRVFARIESPVIGFFDSESHLQLFSRLRRNLSSTLTVVRKVDRATMWSFGLEPEIARIYAKSGYPQHHPNTVVAGYSAAMHAKYDVMQTAIRDNPFRTRYFCWLDVGLFRDLVGADSSTFSMYLPPGFHNDSVAYQDVNGRSASTSVHDIVYANMVWVCGCFFIGEATVMLRWTDEYQAAVRRMIDEHGLMSTDQQVIYAMFNTMKPSTSIQTYKADGRYNEWFHLGFLSRDAGLARRRVSAMTTVTLSSMQGNISQTPR